MVDVAIVTRVSRFELPYLESFVKFYIDQHEVKQILLLVKPATDFEQVREYLRQKLDRSTWSKIKLKRGQKRIWLKHETQRIVSFLDVEYLLVVDADEYLSLGEMSLKQFVSQLRRKVFASAYHFSWLETRFDTLSSIFLKDISNNRSHNPNEIKGNWRNETKYLVRVRDLNILGEHSCSVKRLPFGFTNSAFGRIVHRSWVLRNSKKNNQCIVHFANRSFCDALIKSASSKVFSSASAKEFDRLKEDQAAKIIDRLDEDKLPSKLEQLVAFRHSKPNQAIPENLSKQLKIDLELEANLIHELGFEQSTVNRLWNSYQNQVEIGQTSTEQANAFN